MISARAKAAQLTNRSKILSNRTIIIIPLPQNIARARGKFMIPYLGGTGPSSPDGSFFTVPRTSSKREIDERIRGSPLFHVGRVHPRLFYLSNPRASLTVFSTVDDVEQQLRHKQPATYDDPPVDCSITSCPRRHVMLSTSGRR